MIFMTVIILIAIDLPGNHATRGCSQAVGIVVVVTREHAGPLGLREDQVLGGSMKRTLRKSAAHSMQCKLMMTWPRRSCPHIIYRESSLKRHRPFS